ncbi:MAG: peptidylprolyl isomerase [Candidatus Neomarinimicrobiota bacterium]
MGLMTTLRTRMTIVLWALLVLFLLSMSIGGLVGGANIIDQLVGKVDPTRVIARINDQDISPDYFNNLVNQQINQFKSSGQTVNESMYERARGAAWTNLIQEVLVSGEIKRLGLEATDEEIIYHLRENPPPFLQSNPTFQTDGKFDSQKYLSALASPQGDEWTPIENWMRTSYIPNLKLTQFLNENILVTEQDVKDDYIKKNVKYTVDAIHVTYDKAPKDKIEPSETELTDEYRVNLSDYEHEELRNVSYVFWKKSPSTQDSLDNGYLVSDIIERAKAGENFTDLANEYTQDPSGQEKGGDLGWFGRGQMVKPFEEAAFKASKGSIVGPIVSRFGSHIINVRDKRSENGEEQVLASHILLKVEASPTTLSNLRRVATLFSYDAQDSGFTVAANSNKLAIMNNENLNRSSSRLRTIGSMRGGVRFAFNNKAGLVSDVMENDQYYAVFSVDSLIDKGHKSFESVKTQLVNKVRRTKQKSASRDIIDEIIIDLNANEKTLSSFIESQKRFDTIKDESKTITEGFTSIGKSNFVTGALLRSSENDLLGPLETNRGWALIHVKEIAPLDSTEYEVQRELLRGTLKTKKQNQHLQAWLDELKDNAEIIDNRSYFY